MELPAVLIDAVVCHRLPHSDIGVYVHLATMQEDGRVIGSIKELAALLGIGRQKYVDSVMRLQAAGLVRYRPTDTHYIQSTIEFIHVPENRDDEHHPENRELEVVSSAKEDFDPGLSTVSTGQIKSSDEKVLDKGVGVCKGKGRVYETSEPCYQLAEKLLISIRKNLDPKRRADLQAWAMHVDRLIRLDGRSVEEIDDVIYWLYNADGSRDATFWRTNILSTQKLREKFPTLIARKPKNWRRPRQPSGKKCETCHGNGWILADGQDEAQVCPDCVGGRVPA